MIITVLMTVDVKFVALQIMPVLRLNSLKQ